MLDNRISGTFASQFDARAAVARRGLALVAGLIVIVAGPVVLGQQTRPAAAIGKLGPQTICPVTGEGIDKNVFVDVAGYRIFACCPPCGAEIKADPAKALARLEAKGQRPQLRLVVCPGCGEIKGTPKCCQTDVKRCAKCGLNKGSIGCCKHLKPPAGKKEITICAKCGEIKGAVACCKAGAKKCSKCGLNKGSVGCCTDVSKFAKGRPVVPLCSQCGWIKGTATCCQTAAKKCGKCGLAKGSIGCCKDLASAARKAEVVICPKCGEVVGGERCCKPAAKKCAKCRLVKGSPGCCKLGAFLGDAGGIRLIPGG